VGLLRVNLPVINQHVIFGFHLTNYYLDGGVSGALLMLIKHEYTLGLASLSLLDLGYQVPVN
jgi:hypothetical protein